MGTQLSTRFHGKNHAEISHCFHPFVNIGTYKGPK